MHIELKNIYIDRIMSDETTYFRASVYVNGRRSFLVRNDGHGGCNSYHPFDERGRKALRMAEEYAKTLPPIKFGTFVLQADLDDLIDDLLKKRELIRLCRKATVFRLPDWPEDRWRYIASPFSEKVREEIISRHGESAQFMNDLI